MENFLQGIGAGVGVLLGVVAGTVVTILAHWYLHHRAEEQQTRNLRLELRINKKKIEAWLEELTKYRNAVNGDCLNTWFGYFDLGKTITPTADTMFRSGLLYKKLSEQHLEDLQVVFSDLSITGEKIMNRAVSTTLRQPDAAFRVATARG